MGFTGELKGWWDNLPSPEDKAQIDIAVKTESNEAICVTTLLYAITKFFVGELKVPEKSRRPIIKPILPIHKKRVRQETIRVFDDEGTEESDTPLMKTKRGNSTLRQPAQNHRSAHSSPCSTADKALLEQVVQVVRIKKDCQSTRENNQVLLEQQNLVSQSQCRVTEFEAKAKTKKASLEDDILS
ncbi:hypothetical protein KIW84_063293 [Lathyrus oleraceus]|uniref:Uncharacterized protein n=1 Tax=Pisum sativum TaxID=3888 RepID=A0A9D4W7B1_PEA|nr:hypothetical protein KIW84_063293 [Pisum sativum]